MYNNHVFLDWQDRRLGSNNTDFASLSYETAYPNGSIQSLPTLVNPCESIWLRYFANGTEHQTWFTNHHVVSKGRMVADCNISVNRWHTGIRQIRYECLQPFCLLYCAKPFFCGRLIRNVTKPLASHSVQALRPSNLDSMTDAYHIQQPWKSSTYPGTLQEPVHYSGPTPTNTFWYHDMGPHAYHNPHSGSLLTRVASWPDSIARALGYDPIPKYSLADTDWWQDMVWYTNQTINATVAPRRKVEISRRYWEWDARYPSTYPEYNAPWPGNASNGAAWPAHLYGTLPSLWGELQNDTQSPLLPNIRIM